MRYAGLIKNDVVNGYDVCVSVWCQGCPHRCQGCHNPETWDFNGGIEIDEDELIEEVLEAINKNGIHRNLSILGGEPLCEENRGFTTRLVKMAKEKYPGVQIFLWTGYLFEEAVTFCDLDDVDILIDGKYNEELRNVSLALRGSFNQRVLKIKK